MKSSRMQQLQNNPTSPPSESYTTLSENEKRCAAKIQEFQSDFVGKYPELKERAAFLHPPNEYSIKKFACTAIQPTLLPNTELYDLERCAEFVATFVQYEPLYPEPVIVSPTQLISWGEGDALDTSVLLASLLIGAGFDAYVIVGIAPVYIRLKDQSRMKCTLEERQRDDPTMPWDFEVVINDDSSVKKDDDLGLHCWVLVKPGKRELAGGSCFVESSTGIIYPLNENMPYSQMWCAFSDKNFWINASSGAVPTDDFSTWLQVPGISPYSYVKRIEIPPKLLALRYPPTGRRCLLINKAKIEYFGKAIDPQGVATRIITFEDEAQTIVVQVTELFYPNIRDDGLFQRIRRPFDMSCSERYCDKNPYSIRERSETVSTRTISFDSKTRSDGLVERTESIGKSITEHYHNRSDSLVRRVVSLEKLPRNTKQPRHGSFLSCGTGLGLAEVTRIDDHYAEPFDKAHLKTSVASRSYLFKEKKIVVTYHCRHEALQTRNTFVKDEIFEPDSKGHELLALESKSMSALKEINDEMVELREAMYHWDMRLVTSPETSKVDAAAPSKDAPEHIQKKEFDYLLPYLSQLDNPNGPLTQEEAIKVRDACLQGLKWRLLERANIIKNRLDDARKELCGKQEDFHKDRASRSLEEKQSFESEVADDSISTSHVCFSFNTITRLTQALEKKMKEDERLAILYQRTPIVEARDFLGL